MQMIKMSDLKQINVPRYSELNIKSFWKQITKSVPKLRYFPDYKASQIPDRIYLFNILYTIDPHFVLDKIIQVQKTKVVENKEEKDEVIIIKKDLLKQISDSNYFSSKN